MRHYLNLMTMYKEEDRKIANDILMKLKKEHQVDESDMLEYMNKIYGLPRDSFEFERLCCVLWREMESMGLIESKDRKMRLTRDGHLAAKLGMTDYMLKYEKDRELDTKSKESTVRSYKVAIITAVIAALTFIAGSLISDLLRSLL